MSEYHGDKDSIREAFKNKIEGITSEDNIMRVGNAVTSVLTLSPNNLRVFSKCYRSELYREPEKILSLTKDHVSDHIERADILWAYEDKIIKVCNDLEKKSTISPIYYGHVPLEKRILMEYIDVPAVKDKIMEINEEIENLKDRVQLIDHDKDPGKINEILENRNRLEEQKDYWIKQSMSYIAKFQTLCNQNKEKFAEVVRRGQIIDQKIIEDNLLRTVIYTNPELKTEKDKLEKARELLLSKNISPENYALEIAEYLSTKENDELSLIHGDLGPHHIKINGKIFDFCEFREDLSQYDPVRFLKNPFVNPNEDKISGYLAYFLIEKSIFEGKLEKKKIKGKKLMDIVEENISIKRFEHFIKRFYDVTLREDFHMAAALQKYNDISYYLDGQSVLKTKEDVIDWHLKDIKIILNRLLSYDGRNKILKDPESQEMIEKLRSFSERSGIIKQNGEKQEFKLLEAGIYLIGDPPNLNSWQKSLKNCVTKKNGDADSFQQPSTNQTPEKGEDCIITDIRKMIGDNKNKIGIVAAASIFLAGTSIVSTLTGTSPLKYYADYFSNNNQIEIAHPINPPINPRDQKIEEIIKKAEQNQLHLTPDLQKVAEINGKKLEKIEEVKSVQEQKPTESSTKQNSQIPPMTPSSEPKEQAPIPDTPTEKPIPVSDPLKEPTIQLLEKVIETG